MRALRVVAIASVASGCWNDGGGTADIDAPTIDAPIVDAPPDVLIVEPEPNYQGTITLVEAQVLAPSPGPVNTIVAEGIQLGVTFVDPTIAPGPVLDTQPGTIFGCKVFEHTPSQLAAAAGMNEGTLQFTVDNLGTPANPVFPPCTYSPGTVGYNCPDPTSTQSNTGGNTVTFAQIDAQTSRLTVNAGPATFDANDVGRYVMMLGSSSSYDAPHMAMPIVAVTSPTVVVLGARIPDATITFGNGTLLTLAGAGPTPGLVDPGQLADGASATTVLMAGGGNHFPTTTITYGNVGDDFTMDDTNAGLMRAIPTSGAAFSVSCATCNTAVGTVLFLTTTDGPVTGLSPTAMPPIVSKRVTIRCAIVGQTSITVPANASAYLASSGATRIQATYIRAGFGTPNPQDGDLTAIAGHAIVGFTTP